MNMVNSHNDWGKLKEIILGTPHGLNIPHIDCSSEHFFEPPEDAKNENISPELIQQVISEMQEDFQELEDTLTSYGVKVKRPNPISLGTDCVTPHWESQQTHALMPRDCLAVIGNKIIEAPMPSRSRFFESISFRSLILDYFESGCSWISAPKPILSDDIYSYEKQTPLLSSRDPLFDAANLMRCGRDIFFNISNSGNRAGLSWLQSVLGDQYKVHEISVCSDHLGTTIHILRPGVLLVNAYRMDEEMIPSALKGWQIIWFSEPQDTGYAFEWPRASVWIGMNVLSIDEKIVIIEKSQQRLGDQLVENGFEPIPITFRHGRTVGGGFHCCSLDTHREGELERYI